MLRLYWITQINVSYRHTHTVGKLIEF